MAPDADRLEELMDALAGLALVTEPQPADVASALEAARTLFERAPAGPGREALARAIERGGAGEAPAAVLGALAQAVEALQVGADEAAAPPAELDKETAELLHDFVQESMDGLAVADEILLAAESAGTSTEQIHSLFRVFHTMKGLAGFLDLKDVVLLAHATESLMSEVRDGALALAGESLELVFRSTGLLRTVLEALAKAPALVKRDGSPEVHPQVEALHGFLRTLPAAPAEANTSPVTAPPPEATQVSATPTPVSPPAPRVPGTSPSSAPRPVPPVLESPPAQAVAPPPDVSPPAIAAALDAVDGGAAPGRAADELPPLSGRAEVWSLPAPEPVVAAPSSPRPSAPLSGEPPRASSPRPSAPSPRASAPSPRPSAPGAPTEGARARETVKVDLERVDGMVEMIGELIIVESMLKHAPELLAGSPKVRNTISQMEKISRDLQSAAMRMRMVPLQATFQKMARLTRELARKSGKDVTLHVEGESTEMDRAMVERIEEPLVHLIRNAVDHGVELPEARQAQGKPPASVLKLSASHTGGKVVVKLEDDGRGIRREKVLAKARARGLVGATQELDEAHVLELLFSPGFSTADQVTEVSGRGVGLDVVKRGVEALRGQVLVESTPGEGTTFQLVLPLTLAVIDGMLIAVGQERYLVPSLSIIEALQPQPHMLASIGERDELLTFRGEVMPLLRLSSLLHVSGARDDALEALVVVVESLGKRVGMLVDRVVAQQQVVIKALGNGLARNELYAGAAILSDGNVGLILNVDRLVASRTQRTAQAA